MRTELGYGVGVWNQMNLTVTGAAAQMVPPASLVAITVLSNDGIYATITATAHGLFDGESAQVSGASDANWNGYFVMKVVDANTLFYTMAGVPANTTLGTAAVASFKVEQAIIIGNAANTQNVGIGPNSSANLYPVGAGAFFTIPAIMGSQTQAKKIDLAQWYTLAVSGSQTLRIMWILFMVGFFFCGSALAQPSGVQQLKAGSGITLTPSGGVGVVTVTASGGGGGATNGIQQLNGTGTNTTINGLNATNLAVTSSDAVTQTPLSVIGSTNDFYQLFIQNTHGGTNASSDFVAANDQGGASSSSNYVDLGINSSTFLGAWGVASDGYIYTSTGSSNFIVGVGQTNGTLHLRVGGSAAGQDVMTASSNLITFIKPVTSTNTVTASSFIGAFTGNGSGITNLQANSFSFGTLSAQSAVTNYMPPLGSNVFYKITVTNDVCVVAITNGPGSVSIRIAGNGTSGRFILIPDSIPVLSTNGATHTGTNLIWTLPQGSNIAWLSFVADTSNPALSNVTASVIISGATNAAGSGSGTVTSAAFTGDGTVFNSSVTGSPITTSGTFAPSLATQAANTVLAGPTSGGSAAPTFQTAPTISAANMTSFPAFTNAVNALTNDTRVLSFTNTNSTVGFGSITATNLVKIATNATAPAAGFLGEMTSNYIASASAVSLTSAGTVNVASVSLTAGHWSVSANENVVETAATATGIAVGISSTTASLTADGSECYAPIGTLLSATNTVTVPPKPFFLSATTTIFLVSKQGTISAGSATAFGSITARRTD